MSWTPKQHKIMARHHSQQADYFLHPHRYTTFTPEPTLQESGAPPGGPVATKYGARVETQPNGDVLKEDPALEEAILEDQVRHLAMALHVVRGCIQRVDRFVHAFIPGRTCAEGVYDVAQQRGSELGSVDLHSVSLVPLTNESFLKKRELSSKHPVHTAQR
jgi:hypothetical protein